LVVFSGRGLQAKWLFEKPLPRKALPRWHAVQTELCRRLGRLGADKNALDASRVLRLVGTVNSKSKELARVVFEAKAVSMGSSKRADGVVAYDFEVLANEVLPLYREQMQQVQATRDEQRLIWASARGARDARRGQFTVLDGGRSLDGRKHPNLRSFVPSQLAWDRLGDIRKLAELRGWSEGAPEGERDLPLFLCACFLAQAVIVPKLYPEMEELAREFAPSWTEAQLRSCISSVLSRAKAASRGETVEFKGKNFDPRYRWTNAELLKRLDVSAEEERHLTTIITKEEKARRAAVRSAERRRADGCLPRSEWLAHREQLRAGARLLRAQGWSIRRIAEELGTSPASVHSYCQD
jgi:Putative ATPase subunit of terminase (gpP-like)